MNGTITHHFVKCAKCGQHVKRTSGCQKYCKACSPWRAKRSSAGLKLVTCAKCGKVVERINNRQDYCLECSTESILRSDRILSKVVKIEKIEKTAKLKVVFICKRCKIKPCVGRKRVNCPACEAIVDRQKRAREVLQDRRSKKHKSRLYSFAVNLEPDYDQNWTPINMRFVSADEINRVKENCKKAGVNYYQSIFYKCPDNRDTISRIFYPPLLHGYASKGELSRQGFYRVKPTTKEALYFETDDDADKPGLYYWDRHASDCGEKRRAAWDRKYEIAKKEMHNRLLVENLLQRGNERNAPDSTRLELMTMGFIA